MRPVEKRVWINENGEAYDKHYEPYGNAKDDLIENLGKYCSFCEVPVPPKSSLEVEHVKAKGIPKYAGMVCSWSNFLLGCKNCNPIKSQKDFEFVEIHLPHLNNTLLSFEIFEGGLIKVNARLPEEEQSKAMKLSWLIGIERRPGAPEYSRKDDRWKNRLEAWNLAKKYHQKYSARLTDMDTIIDVALCTGFFAVWMTVFHDIPEIKLALIKAFRGTAKNCFDQNGNPVPRPGGKI